MSTNETQRDIQVTRIPCPFVYANGRRCSGHVVTVEVYKADLRWTHGKDGAWRFSWDNPRSHFHVFCSEKGNHSGFRRPDSDQMKFHFDTLPAELHTALLDAAME